jgi:hypothetical protein
MNLYHVQNSSSWRNAPSVIRAGFIEAMRECQYGAQETRDAWDWYLQGAQDVAAFLANNKGAKL